jgi:lipopolysaccharide/colanic/teichoic acid biosynthesis glycosyltransferase
MLMSGRQLFRNPEARKTIDQIAQAMAISTREIDTFGWHEHGGTLGVLFPEIGAPEPNASLIIEKVSPALQKVLGTKKFDSLEIAFHIFPDDSPEQSDPTTPIFYPETTEKQGTRRGARILKRTVDVLGSLLTLAVLLPVLLAIAILVRLTSHGPVLFRQIRIGQFGIPFTFYKFRSMYTNNDPKIHEDYVARLIDGEPTLESDRGRREVYKITNDPRVTPLGRFLRRASLDELPQLFNVLFGEMSLVGPRPPVRYEYERYQLWHRRRVFDVKPGITGLWQVTGRSRTTFDEMVRLDLTYARKWSVWLDMKILLKTPAAVLSGDGAY